MRTLVLGGTRFIGPALVEELFGSGHAVASFIAASTSRRTSRPRSSTSTRRGATWSDTATRYRRVLPRRGLDLAAMTAADAEGGARRDRRSVTLVAASTPSPTASSTLSTPAPSPTRCRWPRTRRCGGPYPAPERVCPPAGTTTPAATTSSRSSASTWSGRDVCRLPLSTARATTSAARTSCSPGCAPAGSHPRRPRTLLISRGYAPELARALRLAVERGPG